PCGVIRKLIDGTAGEMAEGVASKDVAGDQHNVDGQHDRADADTEAVFEPEGLPHVPDEKRPDDVGESQEVPVEVLRDERETLFAQIRFTWLADRAGHGIHPKSFVIRAPV